MNVQNSTLNIAKDKKSSVYLNDNLYVLIDEFANQLKAQKNYFTGGITINHTNHINILMLLLNILYYTHYLLLIFYNRPENLQ